MIRVSASGSYSKTEAFLKKMERGDVFRNLHVYGRRGVDALRRATPIETGETASSWYYQVSYRNGTYAINFGNDNEEDGVNIAILIQYGHGTGTGAYIQGRDYINPAIQPVFDSIVEDIWRQVKNA